MRGIEHYDSRKKAGRDPRIAEVEEDDQRRRDCKRAEYPRNDGSQGFNPHDYLITDDGIEADIKEELTSKCRLLIATRG